MDSVAPTSATICGGTEITLFGDGFVPGLSVRFGDQDASSVTVVDAQTISVVSPPVVEGTTSVAIVVVTEDEEEVRLEDAFAFEHPVGPFLRGDVNEDETLSVSDAVDLKDVLGQIKTDSGNMHAVAPLSQMTTPAYWRIATPLEQEPSTPSAQRPFSP